MKKFVKIVIYVTILVISLILSDLYILRGKFSHIYLFPFSNKPIASKEVQSKDLALEILKKSDKYLFNFRNKSIKPFFVWTYRNDKTIFEVNDSVLRYHYRLIPDLPEFKNKYEYGLDCGTGAGSFTINPFEKFSSEVTHNQVLNPYYWGAYHQNNKSGDTINDLLYNKPLLIVYHRKNTFKVFDRQDITSKDSLRVQLYLPVFSFDHNELSYIKSNYIKLSYKKIIERMIIEESDVFKQVYD
ncbi:hypothetical protein [Tenacibaculum sp. 190524A05c]|uniref:hypothetical protein n=1 Tax=Tenacibaculum platacis TaxID=3137852 RepID=UPI0032B29343